MKKIILMLVLLMMVSCSFKNILNETGTENINDLDVETTKGNNKAKNTENHKSEKELDEYFQKFFDEVEDYEVYDPGILKNEQLVEGMIVKYDTNHYIHKVVDNHKVSIPVPISYKYVGSFNGEKAKEFAINYKQRFSDSLVHSYNWYLNIKPEEDIYGYVVLEFAVKTGDIAREEGEPDERYSILMPDIYLFPEDKSWVADDGHTPEACSGYVTLEEYIGEDGITCDEVRPCFVVIQYEKIYTDYKIQFGSPLYMPAHCNLNDLINK